MKKIYISYILMRSCNYMYTWNPQILISSTEIYLNDSTVLGNTSNASEETTQIELPTIHGSSDIFSSFKLLFYILFRRHLDPAPPHTYIPNGILWISHCPKINQAAANFAYMLICLISAWWLLLMYGSQLEQVKHYN